MRQAALLLLALLPFSPATAGNLTTLYNFAADAGGFNPAGGPIFDADGNAYGTTTFGGSGCGGTGCGTVFALSGDASGNWNETVLHTFSGITLCGNQLCYDGQTPSGTLVFDAAGALYGTTTQGGQYNVGTVFQLTPTARGKWSETVLYSFTGDPTGDGGPPGPDLVFGTDGNLYGVTNSTVWQLVPPGSPDVGWTFNVLANFNGAGPAGGVTFGKKGVLYGALSAGSGSGFGAGGVFSLTPASSAGGAWKEKLIYAFPASLERGGSPAGGVVVDRTGKVFGTTQAGGMHDDGVVFELKPPKKGGRVWKESVLHNFTAPPDGRFPTAPLTLASGILYGTTSSGGSSEQFGTVFSLDPATPDSEAVLWSFQGAAPAASAPNAPVFVDGSGNVWGFTQQGGSNCQCGTFFVVTP